jgi:hypothetical protein
MKAKGNGKFKSVTGNKTTSLGHRHCVVSLTDATPNLHDTRLKHGCLIHGLLNDVWRFQPASLELQPQLKRDHAGRAITAQTHAE